MTAALVEFPGTNIGDIPARLRTLAESIENGEFDDAHTLVWVIDCGEGRLAVGLHGHAAEPGATAYLMLGLAKHRIELGSLVDG
jgi:hypothetical protein